MKIKALIDKIKYETTAPCSISFEYDPTPTETERLENINRLVKELEKTLNILGKGYKNI